MFLRMSWPSLVPPGRGPDLTHHLLLVDYIQQTGHLVHDRSLDGAMGEMAHYTPAAHLLAVIAGAVFGVDGLRAFFPLVVVCAALTAGFVFLIARRIGLSLPYAIAAVIAAVPARAVLLRRVHARRLPGANGVDALRRGDVVGDRAVGRSAVRDRRDRDRDVSRRDVSVVADLDRAAAARVPRAAVAGGAAGTRSPSSTWRSSWCRCCAIFLVHSWNRWGWMVIVRTSGAVLHPSLESLGWLLPLLAVDRHRRRRERSPRARHDRAADGDRAAGGDALRDRESAGRGHAVHGVQDGAISRSIRWRFSRRMRWRGSRAVRRAHRTDRLADRGAAAGASRCGPRSPRRGRFPSSISI